MTDGDARYLKALVAMQVRVLDQGEAISILNRCEFSAPEIAEMLGATPAAVNKRIQRSKKRKPSKKKGPK